MAIDPSKELTETITTSRAVTLKPSEYTSITFYRGDDGRQSARVELSSGGTSTFKVADFGTPTQRTALGAILDALHVAAAVNAGFKG
jgi:hypothetical protein